MPRNRVQQIIETLTSTSLETLTSSTPLEPFTATAMAQEDEIEEAEYVSVDTPNNIDQKNIACCSCGVNKHSIVVNDIKYCSDCYKKYFATCDRCYNIFDKKDIYNIRNQNMCYTCLQNLCYNFCSKCKKWKKRCVNVYNDGVYCESCLKQLETFRCSYCGNTYHMDRYGKDGYCISCINSNLSQVRNYSYKPQPRFFKKLNQIEDELYFGIQLQMGCVEDYHVVNDFVAEYSNSFFYMKKDTSIPVYGCEIVTQPATLFKHINSHYWKTMLMVAKEYGFNAQHEKCGIHVHISRNYFNNHEIAKLDYFVNKYDIFKKIARRTSHYSEYIDKSCDCWGSQITNRKCALNLSNSSTVELRIFKGTLQYQEVMAYIEICHAIALFSKIITMDQLLTSPKTVIDKFEKLIESNKYKFADKYCRKFKVWN